MGNGRLGAIMFGGVDDERIVLNESSVWSGSGQEADRPDAYKVLAQIQQLLLEGKNSEAEALANAKFTSKGPGSNGGTGDSQYGCYQVLGNLHLSFPGDTNAAIGNYRGADEIHARRGHFHQGNVCERAESSDGFAAPRRPWQRCYCKAGMGDSFVARSAGCVEEWIRQGLVRTRRV